VKHVTDKFGGFTCAKCSRAEHGMAVGNLYKHGIYATCYIYVACNVVVNAKRRSLRKACWEDDSDNAAAQEQVDRPLEARPGTHLQDGPSGFRSLVRANLNTAWVPPHSHVTRANMLRRHAKLFATRRPFLGLMLSATKSTLVGTCALCAVRPSISKTRIML